MTISTKTLLAAANQAYADGEMRIDIQLPAGERGDLLADFIANEISEVTEGMEGAECEMAMIQASSEAIESAISKLQDVMNAISTVNHGPDISNVSILWNRTVIDGEAEFTWTSPEGRTFCVRELAEDRYFLEEFVPNGQIAGRKASASDPTMALVRENAKVLSPKEFFQQLPDGISPDSLVCEGGGLGLGSIYYPTLEDAEEKMRDALKSNEWYRHYDPQLAKSLTDEQRVSGREARESLSYWQDKLNRLTYQPKGQGELFQGLGDLFGPINEGAREDLLRFFNDPSVANWDRIAYRILLGGTMTGWQVWTSADPDAPISKSPSGWETWPSADDFRGHLQDVKKKEIRRAKRQIRTARQELVDLGFTVNE